MLGLVVKMILRARINLALANWNPLSGSTANLIRIYDVRPCGGDSIFCGFVKWFLCIISFAFERACSMFHADLDDAAMDRYSAIFYLWGSTSDPIARTVPNSPSSAD